MALALRKPTPSEEIGTSVRDIEEVLHPLLVAGASERSPPELAFMLSRE